METLETFNVQLAAYLAGLGRHFTVVRAPDGYSHAVFEGAGVGEAAELFAKGRASVEPRAYAKQLGRLFDLLGRDREQRELSGFDPQL